MASSNPKIALAMIVAGTDEEAPLLAKCLASIAHHIDAIYLNLNHKEGVSISPKVRAVAEKYTTNIYVTEWTDNFVKSRNFIFDKVPKKHDWIMWLDADDTVWQPYKIKEITAIASDDIHGIFAQYDYDHDEFGNCTVTHRIVRLVRNNGTFIWKASFEEDGISVHEILTETRNVKKAYSNEFKVVHHASVEKRHDSLLRNIRLLEAMYARQAAKKQVDARVLYYLGREYFNNAEYTRAEPYLMEYIKSSGWAEERSEAWLHLGIIWEKLERNDAARQAFGHSFLENPKSPRALVELGQLEFYEKRYLMSEELLLMAINKKVPETAYAVFPMENRYRAYMLLVQTYINMGFSKLKGAEIYVNKALKLRPADELAKDAQKLVEKLQWVRKSTQAVVRLARVFSDAETPEKIVPVLDALPQDMQDNPAVITLRQKHQKPTRWPKKSIAIFCGNSAEEIWGPWGLEEGGIGGSEEAVIQMSSEMAKQGWQVTVYGTPGSRAGKYYEHTPDGEVIRNPNDEMVYVEWKQYWEFNPKDVFDVFIAWRMPWFFDVKIKARRNYLWLHDVMDKNEFTSHRLSNIDKVIFVSKYHANLYKGVIPDKQWFVSGNGIDPAQFEKYEGSERNAHRCLYTSSQLRGLEILYDIWPEVLKEVPDATLDVYYGWKTFDNSLRDNPERMAWKDKMVQMAKRLPNVTDYGRIGHDQIAKEMSQSGIFAYPCIFPEVYCISLIKSMAAGMYPVTSDYAVLKDFNITGTQVHLGKNIKQFKKEYTKQLITALKESHKPKESSVDQIRRLFAWSETASGWNEEMKG